MVNVNELDDSVRTLVEHADKFFEGTVTREELMGLLLISFQDLSDMFKQLGKRGVLTTRDLGRYQWAATITRTISELAILGVPQYGTPKLEEQLKELMREKLRNSKLVTVRQLADAPESIVSPSSKTPQ